MKINFETLENHHKKVKDIFDSNIGFKNIGYYFWLLLFLKRYSDIFNEEVENIIKKDNASPTAAKFLCFHTKITLPSESRWDDISTVDKNIGEKIKSALILIEEYNKDYGKTLSSTIPIWPQDNVLKEIIEEFTKINLSNKNLEKPTLLSDFYDYLKQNEENKISDNKFEQIIKKLL